MIYFRVLLYYSKHIIALLLIAAFIFKGIASLFPALSCSFFKIPAIECITDAQTENTGKERNEKTGEQEFIADHRTAFQVLNPPGIAVKQAKTMQAGYGQNTFFPVATPPPNFS
jgi:hypothetical protein